MKKIGSMLGACLLVSVALAAEQPVLSVVPAPGMEVTQSAPVLSRAEQKKQFKARRKRINQLVKAYHKASMQEQPAILAALQEEVLQDTQAGLTYVKSRIAAERANLESWEAKVQQDEANLTALNEKRVAQLLAKDAKKQYKAWRKAWKKQMKEARKKMRA